MFLTVLTSVLVTLWVLFCTGAYLYHYFIEVVLDLPLTGQSPCSAHAALKQIIQKLLKDALTLPSLQQAEGGDQQQGQNRPLDESGNRTYEDLLATAILNEVISSCQNNLPCSSTASISSRQSINSSRANKDEDKEYFFGEETLDIKYKNADLESTSASSLEEWINSDHSGSTKYVDRVSLTIQQRIEEVSPTTDEDDEDSEYFRTGSSLLVDDDDANWYLQKRQFQGTHSPVPVPMLVPNPTTEVKVLIGDKEIDETSDLSDVASDYEDATTEAVPGIKSLLLESKLVIGGKNVIESIHLSDAESSADSGVREDRCDEDEDKYFDKPKHDITLDDENIEDVSLISVYSNTEKDTEYTEKYASLPRTITRIVPKIIKNGEEKEENEQEFEGYYSKKEKEKWRHPVELKNNPYSRENIEKRIKGGKTYGSDYYVRQASLPSGAKKPIDDEDEDYKEWSKTFDTTTTYKAIPTMIDSDDTEPEILQQRHITTNEDVNISEITSDSDLSLVNCYDVENQKVFQQTPDGNQKEIKISVNTEGLLYTPKNGDVDEPETVVKVSEGLLFTPENSYEEIDTPKANGLVDIERDENFNDVPKQPPNLKLDLKQKSESSPPTIIIRKSDNTLIKKIYADPVVRSFALNNRDQIPVEMIAIKTPTTPKTDLFQAHTILTPTTPKISTPTKEISTPTSKISTPTAEISNPASKIPTSTKSKTLTPTTLEISIPLSSENSTPTSPEIATFTIIKAENLEIVDGEEFPAPKIEIVPTPNEIELDEIKLNPLTKSQALKLCSDNEIGDNFSLESSEEEEPPRTPIRTTPVKDPEITVLKEKKLVASRLGEFSKSYPNLTRMGSLQNFENFDFEKNSTLPKNNTKNFAYHQQEQNCISVRDLRKLFESNDNTHKPVHSLTARSLSKPLREKLKSDDSSDYSISLSPKIPSREDGEKFEYHADERIKFYENLKQ